MYFIDNKNRLYVLMMVSPDHTYLEQRDNGAVVKIANTWFNKVFKEA